MKNFFTANSVYKQQSEYGKIAFEKGNLMPRRYVFVLTNLCNLRCTFCFQERKKRSDRMTTEDWLKVVNQIPKHSRISLTGGEPLVFKDFDMIFAKANEFSETNIITNGLLLDGQKVERLIDQKNFKILGVSIDTIGNINRDFKKSQWETLVTRLNEFVTLRDKKNHEAALDIKSVILDENIEDLFEIHKFAMKILKADTHSFSMLKGATIQHSDLMFDFQQIDTEYEAYQYKNFNKLVDQLNLIKEYDYKYGYKSYIHPNLINLNDEKKLKKEDLIYLNNKKQIGIFNIRNSFFFHTSKLKTQGSKNFFYGKDGVLEENLSMAEVYLAKSINTIISNNKLPEKQSEDYLSLLSFVAITDLRSPVSVNALNQMYNSMEASINELDPSFLEKRPFPKRNNE